MRFHSTRNTFATITERLGIDSLWCTRYFGHKPQGMMSGLYAGVSPESLRKVAQEIRYPAKVERAIREALGI